MCYSRRLPSALYKWLELELLDSYRKTATVSSSTLMRSANALGNVQASRWQYNVAIWELMWCAAHNMHTCVLKYYMDSMTDEDWYAHGADLTKRMGIAAVSNGDLKTFRYCVEKGREPLMFGEAPPKARGTVVCPGLSRVVTRYGLTHIIDYIEAEGLFINFSLYDCEQAHPEIVKRLLHGLDILQITTIRMTVTAHKMEDLMLAIDNFLSGLVKN